MFEGTKVLRGVTLAAVAAMIAQPLMSRESDTAPAPQAVENQHMPFQGLAVDIKPGKHWGD